jgi:hypothetical protein
MAVCGEEATHRCVVEMNGPHDVIHHNHPCRVAQKDLKAERVKLKDSNSARMKMGILVHYADNAREHVAETKRKWLVEKRGRREHNRNGPHALTSPLTALLSLLMPQDVLL